MAEHEENQSGASTPESGIFGGPMEDVAQTQKLIARAMAAAEPGAVFSAPIERGEYTIITCSELSGGVGAGFGSANDTDGSKGGGGGGGGGSFGRPVAVISIGPRGVEVQPVFDITKVGIAALAAFGALWMSWGRMRRG